jgi:hypothetical protein
MKRLVLAILAAAVMTPVAGLARPTPTKFDSLHVTMTNRVLDPDVGLCTAANPSALAAVGIALVLATRRRR